MVGQESITLVNGDLARAHFELEDTPMGSDRQNQVPPAHTPATPTSQLFQTRPFAPQIQPDLENDPQTPELKKQGEAGEKFSLSKVPLFPASANLLPPPSSRNWLQAKLTMGQPGDPYEQEADRMASHVVQKMSLLKSRSPESAVQRQGLQEDEDELQMKPSSAIQRQDLEDEEESELQMKPMIQCQMEGTVSADIESTIQEAKGSGQPMSKSIRQPMEQAFGADFSGVKIHTDSRSNQLNRSVQAKAFTTGQDVFFRQGSYEPENRSGQELLAHELTHVLQQSGGKTLQRQTLAKPIKSLSSKTKIVPSVSVVQPKIQREFDPNTQAEIAEAVAALPEVPESSIPDEAAISSTVSAGEEAGNDLRPLLDRSPELAVYIHEELVQASAGEEDTPDTLESVDSSRIAQASQNMNALSASNTRTSAASGGFSVAKLANTGLGQTQTGLEVLGRTAEAASSGIRTLGTVSGIVGALFSSITAIFDLRALISSKLRGDALRKAAADAKTSGHDPEIVEAVEYAMEQKYSKALRRAIAFTAGIAATGVSIATLAAGGVGLLALLASNPVGWGIAVGILAIATLASTGLLIYKLYRYIKKKRSGVLGEKRQAIAIRLYEGVAKGDSLAMTAINKLGLPAQDMKDAYGRQETTKESETRVKKYQKYVSEAHGKEIKVKKEIDKLKEKETVLRGKPAEAKNLAKVQKEIQEKEATLAGLKVETKDTEKWKKMPKHQRDDIHKIMSKLAK